METYPAIDPRLPALSNAGKVVVITGASGGVGAATAPSFAASKPKALVLLGRRAEHLAKTAELVRASEGASEDLLVETHSVDLCDAPALRAITDDVVARLGGIDVVVHCAGVLAPVQPLVEADPATFLKGYETTIVGTLSIAQAVILANRRSTDVDGTSNGEKPVTFVNVTTAGILFPPFPGMAAYTSSKLAAVKLLEGLAVEHPAVRVVHVHPGFLRTAMSAQLAQTVTLPFEYNEFSLTSDFLVWAASPEADFLRNRIVFANWDVTELKSRKSEIIGSPDRPGSGELWLSYQGFPRYIGSTPLPGAAGPNDVAEGSGEPKGEPAAKRLRDGDV